MAKLAAHPKDEHGVSHRTGGRPVGHQVHGGSLSYTENLGKVQERKCEWESWATVFVMSAIHVSTMWGLCYREKQCKLLQFSLPANACLLNPKHSPRSWEVKIPILGSLAESLRTEKENQGALKCLEESSQWLWVPVSVSMKEEG